MSTSRKTLITFVAMLGLILGSAASEGRDRNWRRGSYNNWNNRGNFYRGGYQYRSNGWRSNNWNRGNYYYSRPNYYYPNYYPNYYYGNNWRGGIYFGF